MSEVDFPILAQQQTKQAPQQSRKTGLNSRNCLQSKDKFSQTCARKAIIVCFFFAEREQLLTKKEERKLKNRYFAACLFSRLGSARQAKNRRMLLDLIRVSRVAIDIFPLATLRRQSRLRSDGATLAEAIRDVFERKLNIQSRKNRFSLLFIFLIPTKLSLRKVACVARISQVASSESRLQIARLRASFVTQTCSEQMQRQRFFV